MNPLLDFELFAQTCLKIKLKRGEIVPLIFNSAQRKVIQIIKEKYGVERITIDLIARPSFALRLIVLKARQQGISTLIQALYFWILYLLGHQKALTMGHKTDASNNLFDMYKRYYDELPKELQRKLLRSNEKKVEYAKTRSENKIDTAGAGEIGRSDTLQLLHLTEVAFYPDPETTFVGLMQGATEARIHVIESTADGYNEFHQLWESAEKGENNYTPIFLSWLDFPDYIDGAKRLDQIKDLDEDEKDKLIKDLGNPRYNDYKDEEQMLMKDYGATLDQIQWRRYMISSPAINWNINKFHQEYPRDAIEAFIASGSMVFDKNKVQANFLSSMSPIKRGDLVYKYNNEREIAGVEFVENSRGFISIWTEPEEIDGVYRFAGGVDVAEGLAQGDYSAIRVIDRVSSEVHLTWHGHIDPDLLAEEIHKIWLYLNKDCYFAIEKNNHGQHTVPRTFDLGVSLYSKESFSKGYEQRNGQDFGHVTSSKTKKRLVDIMVEWIREDLFADKEKAFWKECMTFVKNPRGEPSADGKDKDPNSKNYDDRVMAAGLMLVCSLWMPSFTKKVKREAVSRSYIQNRTKAIGKTKF